MKSVPRSYEPHHPYRGGYSVLPKLRKISHDEIFQYESRHHQRCLKEKRQALESGPVQVECNLDDGLRESVRRFFMQHHPVQLQEHETLEAIASQISEDVIIHALTADHDWMAYGHVCLPSSWRPEEKVGKSLRELHAPIPGINLGNSRQLVETMVFHGPFERFIWSVVFTDRLNFHPDLEFPEFNPAEPVVFVKVERQVTVGFPDQGGALFLLSESLLSAEQIDRPALAAAIRGMTESELSYKGLLHCRGDLLNWLTNVSC